MLGVGEGDDAGAFVNPEFDPVPPPQEDPDHFNPHQIP